MHLATKFLTKNKYSHTRANNVSPGNRKHVTAQEQVLDDQFASLFHSMLASCWHPHLADGTTVLQRCHIWGCASR